MKPILTLALLLSAATARGQVDFTTVTTPQQNAQALKKAIDKTPPGKTLTVPNGDYDYPDGLTIPAIKLRGESRNGVVLRSAKGYLARQGCCFELAHMAEVENMTLRSTCGPLVQSVLIGFGTESATKRIAAIRDCTMESPVFSVYTWSAPDSNTLSVINCDITAGRCGIVFGRSSGPDAQIGIVRDTKIRLDPTLSTYQGAVTSPVFGGLVGVATRGGMTFLDNVTIEGKGGKLGPRLVGVTDSYDGGSPHTKTYINNLTCKLVQGDAKEMYDVDFRLSQPLIGGTGSAKDGSLIVRKPELAK